jgi:hypothetical protein
MSDREIRYVHHRERPLPDGAADEIRGIVERFEKEHVEAA